MEENPAFVRPITMKTSRKIILFIAAFFFLSAPALAHPGSGILVDRLGQVFFIDTGSGLWKIDTKGALTHLSPLRNHWLALDPNDRFTQSRLPTDPARDWVITAAGSNPTILISTDFPLVIGQDGNLYYPSVRESDRRILRHKGTGGITTFATLPRSAKGEQWINGIAGGPDGSIYYTDDAAIGRITARGTVSTLATVSPLAKGPKIPGNDAHPYLRGLKVDANGAVYVADAGDSRVLKITPDGKIATVLQLESPWAPTDVAVFGDIVYVLEFSHTPGDDRTEWMPRIRKITPDGRSTIIVMVDQMPGARPPKPAAPITSNVLWVEFLDLLVRSFIFAT
ncbi:MAG: SMP-30/gluconolactonase/LRE family protein [Pyrinomonadaceae bacterium]